MWSTTLIHSCRTIICHKTAELVLFSSSPGKRFYCGGTLINHCDNHGGPWPRFVAQWGVLMQPKNPYRMTPGVRHSGIVNWLIYLFIYLIMVVIVVIMVIMVVIMVIMAYSCICLIGRPFLNASKRELLADCALPVSVLLMSFFGSYLFRDVKCESVRFCYLFKQKYWI